MVPLYWHFKGKKVHAFGHKSNTPVNPRVTFLTLQACITQTEFEKWKKYQLSQGEKSIGNRFV